MSKLTVPKGYKSPLSLYKTQSAIGIIKRHFENKLRSGLNLKRASAPLFVDPSTGLNDDLNGIERPVEFGIKETGTVAQVVHSLAKWKRMALYKYGFPVGEGLYADMNAIRRDEEMDNLHSIYVDQWDWERVIRREDRNIEFLKKTVEIIINIVVDIHEEVKAMYPELKSTLSRDIKYITTYELEDMYPELSPKERENKITSEYKTVCLMQIGDKLKNGKPHDGRAPDYDDWSLNCDILFWNDTLGCAFEVSSMGIRVDEKALDEQLKKADCDDRRGLTFHKMLLSGELPLTMGGGIGQSRICMLLLEKAHIGEVQVSLWDKATVDLCAEAGIELL